MRAIRILVVLVSFGLVASTASAGLVDLGTLPKNNGEDAELDQACELIGAPANDCPLNFDFKFDSFPLSDPPVDGMGTHGDYQATNYVLGVSGETTSTVDLSWIMDSGYGLFVIGVKQSQDTRWYGLTDDMRENSGGFVTLDSVAGETAISHVSLFAGLFDGGNGNGTCDYGGVYPECDPQPIPEPGTLGLLGLGLLGLGLRRRNKA